MAEAAVAELEQFGGAGLHAVRLAQRRLDQRTLHAGDIALQVHAIVGEMLRRRRHTVAMSGALGVSVATRSGIAVSAVAVAGGGIMAVGAGCGGAHAVALQGKLHVKVGDSDTYYLDRAVRLLDQFLRSTREPGHGPWFAGDVEFGRGEPHCWTGDPFLPTTLSRPAIERRLLPKIAAQMLKTAPRGADVTSWRY